MNKTKKGIVAFLLAAALLVSMVGMASAASQRWDFDSDHKMYKSDVHVESGTIQICPHACSVKRYSISYSIHIK